ncbi:Homeobox-leucine zipper protein HOX32 [Platanthera zijinensis]|uniref:Homeobox-leucine zipper protein HOX32 n=1 Tax=Platanthera zijinensis TaxID=2320716 RepID=A0AAP0B043_9ASPA
MTVCRCRFLIWFMRMVLCASRFIIFPPLLTMHHNSGTCLLSITSHYVFRQASGTIADTSCESIVISGQHHQQQNPTPQHPASDANNLAGLLAIAEETLAEFWSKATGTAVEWVQLVGMKPGTDSIGIIAVSHNYGGVAARACGLVSLEPTKVAEILKDRLNWYRDCRAHDVLTIIPTGNGASPRDFWILRYTTRLEDESLVICMRSLTASFGGPYSHTTPNFVRAEMLSSVYLIRPYEGGGSMIHIVDHLDLDALQHIKQIAQEVNGDICYGEGLSGIRVGNGFLGSQVNIHLAHTVENEEVLEVVRMEGNGLNQDDFLARDLHLLQLSSGIDENAVGACAQLLLCYMSFVMEISAATLSGMKFDDVFDIDIDSFSHFDQVFQNILQLFETQQLRKLMTTRIKLPVTEIKEWGFIAKI